MTVTKITDPNVFLSRASTTETTVYLTGILIPEIRSERKVWMVPALQLDYSLTFLDTVHYEYGPFTGSHTWTFLEQRKALVAPGRLNPEVDIVGTLLDTLQSDPAKYKIRFDDSSGYLHT